MTENSKKIDKLLRLAKDVDEPTFQRKSQYQSFKSKKGITPSEIQRFIDGIESILFSTLHKYLVCQIDVYARLLISEFGSLANPITTRGAN